METSLRKGLKSLKFLGLSLLLVSCASESKKESCPTVEEEPVSVCRARLECRNQSSSVGVGVGVGFGVGSGLFGLGVGQRHASDQYERCLDIELEKQQAAQNRKSIKTQRTPTSNP